MGAHCGLAVCTLSVLVLMQASVRGWQQRRRYIAARSKVMKVQSVVRCHLARQRYLQVTRSLEGNP